MATTASLLGTYAPQMQEPYQIETNLADRATGGSAAMANTLLGQYWLERQMREGQYADRMANQMAFGQQQLHAQLQDSYLKALPDITKAGLLPAVASSPYFAGATQGMDPNALGAAATQAATTAQATNLGNIGRAMQGAGAGGYNLNIPQLSGVAGIDISQGTPTAVQAAQINAAGRVAAANARGASGGGPGVRFTGPPDESMGGMSPSITVPKAVAAQGWPAVQAWYRSQGFPGGGPTQAPNPNATGAVNTAPPPVRTNVPPAPVPATTATTTTTAPPPPPPKLTPGTVVNQNDPGVRDTANAVRQVIANNKSLSAADRQNLQGFQLKVGTDGSVHVHGSDGKDYGALGGKVNK